MSRRAAWLVASVTIIGALVVGPIATSPVANAACDHRTRLSAAQLNADFANPGLGGFGGFEGFGGGDYQHAYPLPDGRILWLFQDEYFSNDNLLSSPPNNAAHNAGLIQNGTCFTILGTQGRDLIGDAQTIDGSRWFWPLDGEIGVDGNLWIFVAEMSNFAGQGATLNALPVRTWLAVLDSTTFKQLYFAPAPDTAATKQLYGWSVVSDDQYSYLYGHCYRQFANNVNGPGQFDSTCMPSTYVARVPLGHFDMQPTYWNGSGWSDNAQAAVPVMTRGAANPMSVQWFGDRYVSVTKADDWWGQSIYVDVAAHPQGPWTTARTINVVADRKCDTCGNYSAFLMPWLDASDNMTIGLSNGSDFSLWLANGSLYRPTFYTVPLPALAAGTAVNPPPFPVAPGNSGFQAVDPVRLLDTREPGQQFGRLRAGAQAALDLTGMMPSGATAVALNLTAVNPAWNGWVRAYPCNAPEPATSNVNPTVGEVQTNAVIVAVGDGRVCFKSLSDVDIVIDLNGWLTTASNVGLQPIRARRLVDTRLGVGGSGRMTPGQTLQIPVVAAGSSTTAVALTITAVDPGVAGYVTAWPCGQTRPLVSNLNPEPAVTRPNFVNVRVGAGGKVCVYTLQATDLVVDVTAEYQPGAAARYTAMQPQRLLDSRFAAPPWYQGDLSYVLPMSGVAAAQVNLTATDAVSPGYLTAYNCMSEQWPGTSNVNYVASLASANSALITNSRGYACVFAFTPTQLVVDLFGIWA